MWSQMRLMALRKLTWMLLTAEDFTSLDPSWRGPLPDGEVALYLASGTPQTPSPSWPHGKGLGVDQASTNFVAGPRHRELARMFPSLTIAGARATAGETLRTRRLLPLCCQTRQRPQAG